MPPRVFSRICRQPRARLWAVAGVAALAFLVVLEIAARRYGERGPLTNQAREAVFARVGAPAVRGSGPDDGGAHLAAAVRGGRRRDRHRPRLRAGAVGGRSDGDRGALLRQRRAVGDPGVRGGRPHPPHRPGPGAAAEGRRTGAAAGGRPQDGRRLAADHLQDPPGRPRPVRGDRRPRARQPVLGDGPPGRGHRTGRPPPARLGLRPARGGRGRGRPVPAAQRGRRAPLPPAPSGAHLLADRPARSGRLHDLPGGRAGLPLRHRRLRHRRRGSGRWPPSGRTPCRRSPRPTR